MRSRQLPFYLAAAAGGAALAYYLDSQQGRRRRHVTRDKALSLAKHGTRRGRKLVYHVSADARGFVERARHARGSAGELEDRKSTRLNSSHITISYAVFCLKKKKK